MTTESSRKRSRFGLPLTFIILIVGGLGLTKGCTHNSGESPAGQSDASTDKMSDGIKAVAEKHGSIIMSMSPEWATQMGVGADIAGEGFKSRLSSFSAASNREAYAVARDMRSELLNIDRSALSGRDLITYDVMDFSYDMAARQNAFRIGHPSFLSANPPYAVNQLFGPQIDLPRLLIAQHPVRSASDAEAWLSRLSQVERVLGELCEMTTADAAKGVVPPYFALEAISKSSVSIAETTPKSHQLYVSFENKLNNIDTLSASERAAYLTRAETIIADGVFPAYTNFASCMSALIPLAGRDAGVWRLPQGDEIYQVALEAWGANGLSADEIHDIGLQDVKRIHSEMDIILRASGYADGSVGERMARLAKDPKYIIANTDDAKAELVTSLQSDVDDVLEIAPEWFMDVPPYNVEVRRIPIHEQDSSASGYYTPPPLDGSRPGIFWVNMKDSADFPTYTLKSLVFHEAVPGHHFQAGKALSITDLPLIQNLMWFGDYGEGWALYAEELAKEMGMYEGDSLGDLGRYRMELYRAARLVVDTGLHHKRWSRQQAIDYMVGVTGESRESIMREIDRYSVWPGQAASYKLGMIQFQKLRQRAEQELGKNFDIKEFHDVVLRDGPMPMAVLEARVNDWIEDQKQWCMEIESLLPPICQLL